MMTWGQIKQTVESTEGRKLQVTDSTLLSFLMQHNDQVVIGIVGQDGSMVTIDTSNSTRKTPQRCEFLHPN